MDIQENFIGKLLDRRYQIVRVIGVGGMSIVFEANDLVMNRLVAVKVLKEEMYRDREAVDRFVNEAKISATLSHPNIVKIYDVSIKSTPKYIVMERVEGITLKSYMQKKGALSTDEVLSYSEQILKALAHIHENGIVHRDIKPQNILLLKNGRIKVTDFGIAKTLSSAPVIADDKAIGTVYYISPEQASGKEIDRRSDLYSLGILMYEMATGTLPFNADTPVSVAMMQVKDKPKPPSDILATIPYGLEQIILGAIEKTPERRFQNAEQMLRYVERLRVNPDSVFKLRKEAESEAPDKLTFAFSENDMKRKRVGSRGKRKQSRSMFPIIFGVTAAFLIVLVIGMFTILDMVLKNENENASYSVEIPGVVGELYGEQVSEKFDSRIFSINIEYVYNANYPANTIISQAPEGGSKRMVGGDLPPCQITLTVSRGTEMVSVPDYTIMEHREVQKDIIDRGLGFKWVYVEQTSDTVPIGYVIKTVPAAKTSVPYGTTLYIYYSVGAATPEKVTVPVLTGLSPKDAYVRLGDNFRVGKVTYEYSNEIPEGCIISQSHPSGTQVNKGTTLDFVLSLGKHPETSAPITTPPETTSPSETTDDEDTPAQTTAS